MSFTTVKALYFSATDVTKKYVTSFCSGITPSFEEISFSTPVDRKNVQTFKADELVVIGIPVYFGRVPSIAMDYIKQLNGNGANAIAIVTYGNRDIDDALAELGDTLTECGFNVIAGASFVGRHSFGEAIAGNRPNQADLEQAKAFGEKIIETHNNNMVFEGNRPYQGKEMSLNLKAATTSACNNCGICAKVCPGGAISFDDYKTIDTSKCVACHACEVKCPENAKVFKGLKPKILVAGCKMKFGKNKCENKLFV